MQYIHIQTVWPTGTILCPVRQKGPWHTFWMEELDVESFDRTWDIQINAAVRTLWAMMRIYNAIMEWVSQASSANSEDIICT